MKAVLKNQATQEDLFWDNVDEDEKNFYLLGYRTEKYGEVSTVKTLPKFLWILKEVL